MQSIKLASLRNLIPGLYLFHLIAMEQGTKGIGIEIPATCTFQHKKPSKLNKLRELLKDKEDKDDKAA